MISFGILEPLRIFIISDYFWPIIFGVPAILLAVIFILEKRAKKWYAENKILVYEKSFFMLKDRINNIYINCYKYKDNDYDEWYRKHRGKIKYLIKVKFDNFAHEYFASFTGQMFINSENKLMIRETNELNNNEINVYRDYDMDYFERLKEKQFKSYLPYETSWKESIKFNKWSSKKEIREILLKIKFKSEFDYERTSEIEYTMDIKGGKVEGVFEVIRKPEMEIREFYIPVEQTTFTNDKYSAYLGMDEVRKMLTNYLFNFNYPFIRGKEKINSAISKAYYFDENFKEEKGRELEKEFNNKEVIIEKFHHYDQNKAYYADKIGIIYYKKLKDFRCFDILYYDDELICIYKRTVEADERRDEAAVKNHSFIFELSGEKSINSYLRDLVVDSKELLSKYVVPDYFYDNIDDLIFLLTDTGIIVMPEYTNLILSDEDYDLENTNEKIASRIFISSNDLKNYLNRSHSLFNFFDRQ
ncbi:hypothetical protein Bint_0655 [Brachyspira intermedia PWS/A]|uniref:Uncharacterized protein n=1 Tax=Brachyspira intermedia (strain ATCC 51140 / PWS/A) TaxID=1045858 RepID=G0EK96_BRAIP|nr:hypothetical protein [Brachyspira intermedia]AEM21284.1 hypothetical protein Bint_0655 [Brachyspira intermedia PWS/A]